MTLAAIASAPLRCLHIEGAQKSAVLERRWLTDCGCRSARVIDATKHAGGDLLGALKLFDAMPGALAEGGGLIRADDTQ
jgi:hypothetical protein